jgi:hypothetical protein
MGSLSFISVLLKALRRTGRPSLQRATRVLTWKASGSFFDPASPHCRLQPVRSAIRKDRRR